MPEEVRRYLVSETRRVVVTAKNPADAVREASTWLYGGGSGGVDGIPEIRVTDISAMED